MRNEKVRKSIGICMATGNYFPEISGGTLQCRTLINALKSGVSFSVIATTGRPSASGLGLVKQEAVDGIPIYRIPVSQDSSPFKLGSVLQILLIFLKHQKNFRILHIHGFTAKAALFILLAKIFGKKVIIKITLMGVDDPYTVKKDGVDGALKHFFYALSDLVVSPSPCLTRMACMSGFPRGKVKEIPNGVNISLFRPAAGPQEQEMLRKKLNLPKEKRIMLFVGYCCREKGVRLLFKAWMRIRERLKNDVLVVLIGSRDPAVWGVDASLVKWTDEQIRLYAMAGEFLFIEKTHEIEKYYKAADIFLFLSRREGLPNALLEAMSCALPSVAVRLAGVTDTVIDHGLNGLLIEQEDIEALAKNMENLANDRDLCCELGKNAREKITRHYSIYDIALRYADIYAELSRS